MLFNSLLVGGGGQELRLSPTKLYIRSKADYGSTAEMASMTVCIVLDCCTILVPVKDYRRCVSILSYNEISDQRSFLLSSCSCPHDSMAAGEAVILHQERTCLCSVSHQ